MVIASSGLLNESSIVPPAPGQPTPMRRAATGGHEPGHAKTKEEHRGRFRHIGHVGKCCGPAVQARDDRTAAAGAGIAESGFDQKVIDPGGQGNRESGLAKAAGGEIVIQRDQILQG
jgi:hypothetical protein